MGETYQLPNVTKFPCQIPNSSSNYTNGYIIDDELNFLIAESLKGGAMLIRVKEKIGRLTFKLRSKIINYKFQNSVRKKNTL